MTRSEPDKPRPAHEVVLGAISGRVWANPGRDGPWYSVTVVRCYTDANGVPRTATSFGRDDLLVAAEVFRLLWLWVVMKEGALGLPGKTGGQS